MFQSALVTIGWAGDWSQDTGFPSASSRLQRLKRFDMVFSHPSVFYRRLALQFSTIDLILYKSIFFSVQYNSQMENLPFPGHFRKRLSSIFYFQVDLT